MAGFSLFSESVKGLWISISGFESLGGSQLIARDLSLVLQHPQNPKRDVNVTLAIFRVPQVDDLRQLR